MTDKELIKRLRVTGNGLSAEWLEYDVPEATNRTEELEAKLAKAVEALRYYAVEAMPWDADDSLVARTTLAELEAGGEPDQKQGG